MSFPYLGEIKVLSVFPDCNAKMISTHPAFIILLKYARLRDVKHHKPNL
jgi:hypothetical protein